MWAVIQKIYGGKSFMIFEKYSVTAKFTTTKENTQAIIQIKVLVNLS